MTEDNEQTDETTVSTMTTEPDGMTEQIEASFGPMTVYVSSADSDVVLETFDHVWEEMMDTSDKMHERSDDEQSGRRGGQSFS